MVEELKKLRSRKIAEKEGKKLSERQMDNQTQRIPKIHLSDFPGEYENLRKACEEWGCFRVLNHGIPLDLMEEMKKVVGSLLDLPMEIKTRNQDVIAGSGYMAPSPKNPLYEALGLYDMASSQAVHHFCSQLDATPSQRFPLFSLLVFMFYGIVAALKFDLF